MKDALESFLRVSKIKVKVNAGEEYAFQRRIKQLNLEESYLSLR